MTIEIKPAMTVNGIYGNAKGAKSNDLAAMGGQVGASSVETVIPPAIHLEVDRFKLRLRSEQ